MLYPRAHGASFDSSCSLSPRPLIAASTLQHRRCFLAQDVTSASYVPARIIWETMSQGRGGWSDRCEALPSRLVRLEERQDPCPRVKDLLVRENRLGGREIGAVVRDDVNRGAKDMLSAGWRTANGLAPMEAGTRGWEGQHSLAGAGDPQLTQAELQGRALHPQAYRGAVWSSKHPIRLLKHGQDMLALGLFQGVVVLGAHTGGRRFEVDEWHL